MEPKGPNERQSVCSVQFTSGQHQTTLFDRDRQVAVPGAKSAVSDCIMLHAGFPSRRPTKVSKQ